MALESVPALRTAAGRLQTHLCAALCWRSRGLFDASTMHGSTFAYPSVGPVQIANGTGVCGGRLRSVHTGQRRLVVARGLGEDFQKFMDSLAFEKWAPRSSQAWRLGKTPRSVRKGTAGATEQGKGGLGGCGRTGMCDVYERKDWGEEDMNDWFRIAYCAELVASGNDYLNS